MLDEFVGLLPVQLTAVIDVVFLPDLIDDVFDHWLVGREIDVIQEFRDVYPLLVFLFLENAPNNSRQVLSIDVDVFI